MAEASDMRSTILAVVIGGWQPGVENVLERFSAGLSEGGAEMVTWVVQASTDDARMAELVALAKASAGIVLAAGEPNEAVAAALDELHDVAVRATPGWELVGVFGQAVGTSLAALPANDPRARQVIRRLNARLYDWGAVIVPPGFGVSAVTPWYDNRPGALRPDGALTHGGSGSLERHGRRLARVAALLHAEPRALTPERL